MRFLITFLFLLFFNISFPQIPPTLLGGHNVNKKIPTEWVSKIRNFNYKKDNAQIIKEFESFIEPDTLDGKSLDHDYTNKPGLFNAMFVNLDSNNADELICLIGWEYSHPYLGVFKQLENTWYLIYYQQIDTFYEAPSLIVANCFSKSKTFFLKHVYEHGSGIYIDVCSFYKLVDNKVYQCLDLVNNAHIYGWGLYLNQEVKLNFDFSPDEYDQINANYTYNFFPGAINQKKCSWCVDPDFPIIKADGYAGFKYDTISHKYKIEVSENIDNESLTPDKIACFGDFGNDELFVKAFKKEIKEVQKSGSLRKKLFLKNYLAIVKKSKAARTEKLKKKAQIGGTSFY